MAGAGELLGGGHAGRAGTDDRDLLARLHRRRLRDDIAHLVGLVGKRLLDGLDGDRHVLEVQRAGLLAGRGADAAGEFREVVGRMQVADRLFPVAAVDEVVPVGDLVVDRTPGRPVAVGNAAIHAARRLLLDLLVRHRDGEFTEMADAVGCRLILHDLPVDLQKTCNLAHRIVLLSSVSRIAPVGAWDALRQGPEGARCRGGRVTRPLPPFSCVPCLPAHGDTRPA